jgi:hypothetical protein
MSASVEDIHTILTTGIYSYLSKEFGIKDNSNSLSEQQRQHRPHQRALKAVREEKRVVKKQLRALRRDGTPDEVAVLARAFHHLVKKYSKLLKEEKLASNRKNQRQQRRACHHNFSKYARNLLDDNGHTKIQPAFSRSDAEAYFSSTYSSVPKTYYQPTWMPDAQQPTAPFDEGDITPDEVQSVIQKSKSASSPSPLDHTSYHILKKCPSLLPSLLHLFNICWRTATIPIQWKTGVILLLGKPAAKEDASSPNNFRPIALTSCIGKIYTSILKNRLLSYMISNSFLDTTTQKAFVDGIPGCTEHHLRLFSLIEEARHKRKSISICWLDLANAYGSVHHDLIRFSLRHYHAPQSFISVVSNLYQDLTGIIRTKSWTTSPFPLQIGVFQGDPLSVVIFNTVINTLVDSLLQFRHSHGYKLSDKQVSTNLLQYADDTCLVSDGPSSCQDLLHHTERWLEWSGMKPKVPKCRSLAIHASTAEPYDPKLELADQIIPFIEEGAFKFLGAPVYWYRNNSAVRTALEQKLSTLLDKVDQTLLSVHQKLKLYKEAICPRLAWDLSISSLSISWIESALDCLVTRTLKRWIGLARTASPDILYLPKNCGGFNIPTPSRLYKKQKCALSALWMCSRDPTVRLLAEEKTKCEQATKRQKFRPFQETISVWKDDPGVTKKTLSQKVKAHVTAQDTKDRLQHCGSLKVQGRVTTQFQDTREARLWSEVVSTLPDHLTRFAVNAVTDTLPHNANLHLWRKQPSPQCQICPERQTLHHVLNHCSTALRKRRYDERHNQVLGSLANFLRTHLPPGTSITADLPGESYAFPQHIVQTDQRPDIVIWSASSITLIELTIPFETGMDDAAQRKSERYSQLLDACSRSHQASLVTIEVGSRGFLSYEGLKNIYHLIPTKPPLHLRTQLEKDLIKKTLCESYTIWCKRNWRE